MQMMREFNDENKSETIINMTSWSSSWEHGLNSASQSWVECEGSCKAWIYLAWYSCIFQSEVRTCWRGNDTDAEGQFGQRTEPPGCVCCHHSVNSGPQG